MEPREFAASAGIAKPATGASPERPLTGEKARRIIEAMRDSVSEVGIAESTFDRVAAKAEVSRGLLHYYFGTKERLLVEVIRRDTEYRIDVLGAAMRKASSVDEMIAAVNETFSRTLASESGYVFMVSELFVAGRRNPEVRAELGALYARARRELAGVLRKKEGEGVIRLRTDAESVLTYLFAAGDGATVQLLTDRTVDAAAFSAVGYEIARFLLDASE